MMNSVVRPSIKVSYHDIVVFIMIRLRLCVLEEKNYRVSAIFITSYEGYIVSTFIARLRERSSCISTFKTGFSFLSMLYDLE